MAAGSQLKEVEPVNADRVDAGDVPEGLGDALVLVVHHQGAKLLHAAAVAHLALAGTHALGAVDLWEGEGFRT